MKAKKGSLFLFSLFFILCSSIVYSQYYQDYTDGSSSDSYYSSEYGNETRIPDWYEVSDEEVEFCSAFAGSETAADVYESAESELVKPVSKLTLALQAESTVLYDKTLYEIAWYVQPLDEDITYTIYLVEEDGEQEELIKGSAPAATGDAGYETVETETVYVSAQIVLEDGSLGLQVPIVEKSQY